MGIKDGGGSIQAIVTKKWMPPQSIKDRTIYSEWRILLSRSKTDDKAIHRIYSLRVCGMEWH